MYGEGKVTDIVIHCLALSAIFAWCRKFFMKDNEIVNNSNTSCSLLAAVCQAYITVHTLSQVKDSPGHLQPLVPVRHLQRIQQPHHIRPLLLHRELDPPPASSFREDTTAVFKVRAAEALSLDISPVPQITLNILLCCALLQFSPFFWNISCEPLAIAE